MTVTDRLEGASNVLLREPSMGGDREVCTSLLTAGMTAPSVLFVTYTRQPDDCVAQLDGADDVRAVGVIAVGDAGGTSDRTDVLMETVSTPSDLTGLGIDIGQFLSEWESPVVVCFDSLTSMLQYVDFETAYEFLHAITGQIHAAGARAHFHIDPGAHDDQHVAAVTSLFDASVTTGDSTEVRTRDIIE